MFHGDADAAVKYPRNAVSAGWFTISTGFSGSALTVRKNSGGFLPIHAAAPLFTASGLMKIGITPKWPHAKVVSSSEGKL